MRRTIQEQIRANIRLSWFYSALMVVLLAALGGAIAGAYDPRSWYLGAGAAAIAGILVALWGRYQGAQTVLKISQAREATPFELQVVQNVTEEMAIAAGIRLPQVYIIEDSAPNAFATGMDPEHGVICITTGLLRKLDRDELQGVIAHEMGHIRNYDIRLMTTLAMVAGLIPLIADFFMRQMWWGGGPRRSRDRDSGSDNSAQAIFLVIAIVLAILAPLFAKLLEMAVSRKREFLADATAAQLTRYPEGLARALQKITADPDPLEAANRATAHMYIVNPLAKLGSMTSNLFSTHPPTEERIRALVGNMGVVRE